MTKSEKFWNKVAKGSAKPAENLDQTTTRTIEETKKYIGAENFVLDFGCGSGTITNRIAENVRAVHAIDTSSGMIEVAKRNSRAKNITFAHITIFDEHLSDGSYDVIMAFNVLHHVDDLALVIQRIHSLLKPDGIFISSTACMRGKTSFMSFLVKLLIKMSLIPPVSFFKVNELETVIKQGGFELLDSKSISPLPDHFITAQKT